MSPAEQAENQKVIRGIKIIQSVEVVLSFGYHSTNSSGGSVVISIHSKRQNSIFQTLTGHGSVIEAERK